MCEIWNQRSNKGVTIIELLVTIGIIVALTAAGVVSVSKIRSAKNQITCVNNLRSIYQGLQAYYNDYMTLPEDGHPDDDYGLCSLSTELSNYIRDKSTFICPEDTDATSIGNFASYDPYYIARKGSYDSNELALSCPRHRGARNSTSTFSTGATEITSVGRVLDKNGQEIPLDGTTAQRKISNVNSTMTFDDGSVVTVTNASGDSYGCFLVQSIRLSDGTLYSIIKVQANGTIDVQVTSDSKFEVITPSAIVGVRRGAQFAVSTSSNGSEIGYKAYVSLTSGIVVVTDRETGNVSILKIDGTTSTITGDMPFHSHYHTHVNGERHMHGHASRNQTHHGKPLAGADDDEAGFIADADSVTICHKSGTAFEQTMAVENSDLPEHLKHGDSVGACSP